MKKKSTYIEDNAALNKVIKQDGPSPEPVKLAQQSVHSLRTQPIAKRCQSLCQLVLVDVTGIVSVKGTKAVLPVSNVFPQRSKIFKTYSALVLFVKHT